MWPNWLIENIRRSTPLLLAGFACLGIPACDKSPAPVIEHSANPLARQLSGARLDAAKAALEKNHRDEALLLLVSALKADPTHQEVLLSLRTLLSETRWYYPSTKMDVGLPVEKLALSKDSLWTSVSGGYQLGTWNTTARWDLDQSKVAAVLFPRQAEQTQALSLSPDQSKIVIQRGTPGDFISLLCDANTLRPIRNLGNYPENCSVAEVTTFSPDGLLIAYPQANHDMTTWRIVDAASGEVIRSHDERKELIPLSASLDRNVLNVYHADGTQLNLPVSPTEPAESLHATSLPKTSSGTATIQSTMVEFLNAKTAPIRSTLPVSAFISQDERAVVATVDGKILIHRLLPVVRMTGRGAGPVEFPATDVTALISLAEGLTGLKFDEEHRTFAVLSETERRFRIIKAGKVSLPGLDFSLLCEEILATPCTTASPDAAFALHDRISRASETRRRYLAIGPEAPSSEPSSVEKIQAILRTGNSTSITEAIQSIPEKDPAAAAALSIALDSDHPEWLIAFHAGKTSIPPLLQKLVQSRIHWLEGDKAGSIALWRDGFPDIKSTRRAEDWDGWETVDFTPQFASHFIQLDQELSTFDLPADASPERQKALAGRLLDPETARGIGKNKHAEACLQAAQEMARDKETATLAMELAIRARELGALPVPCLRAEATAYTSLEMFPKAHECWISIITDQPLDQQQSSDYTEAAYLAFETNQTEQAMEILKTGLHRYPKDSEYAYRAGWISLLTLNWDYAHLYLMAGERIGFTDEHREKALAMLAISSSECGYSEDAADYFEELAALDPSWAEQDPPKTDGWPPELKISLHQLAHPPKATPITEDGSLLDMNLPPTDGTIDPLAPLDPVPQVEDLLPLPQAAD